MPITLPEKVDFYKLFYACPTEWFPWNWLAGLARGRPMIKIDQFLSELMSSAEKRHKNLAKHFPALMGHDAGSVSFGKSAI